MDKRLWWLLFFIQQLKEQLSSANYWAGLEKQPSRVFAIGSRWTRYCRIAVLYNMKGRQSVFNVHVVMNVSGICCLWNSRYGC